MVGALAEIVLIAWMPDARDTTFLFTPCGCQYEPNFHWYCVNTAPRQEILALQRLRMLGLTAWLPQKADGDRPFRPVFPRYLFVQLDLRDDVWRDIYRQPGVVTILGTQSGRPAAMPRGALEVLWKQCAPNGVIYTPPAVVAADGPDSAGDSLSGRQSKLLPGSNAEAAVGQFSGFEHITEFSASACLAILMRAAMGGAGALGRREVVPA